MQFALASATCIDSFKGACIDCGQHMRRTSIVQSGLVWVMMTRSFIREFLGRPWPLGSWGILGVIPCRCLHGKQYTMSAYHVLKCCFCSWDWPLHSLQGMTQLTHEQSLTQMLICAQAFQSNYAEHTGPDSSFCRAEQTYSLLCCYAFLSLPSL